MGTEGLVKWGDLGFEPSGGWFGRYKAAHQTLKVAFEDKNIQEQIASYCDLGDLYMGTDYILAAAYYNFALALIKNSPASITIAAAIESDVLGKVSSVALHYVRSLGVSLRETNFWRQHVLKGNTYEERVLERWELASYQRHQDSYKDHLTKIRTQAKADLKAKKDIQEIFIDINKELRSLVKKMWEDCVAQVSLSDTQIPKHAFIALGSLARDEGTPYSDLEWALIISEGQDTPETQKFLQDATKLFFISLINLGETTPRQLDIEALAWISDEQSPTPKGFTLDGQMHGGCKTPLGNRHLVSIPDKNRYKLIYTPSDFTTFFKEEWYAHDHHFPTALNSFAYVAGDVTIMEQYRACIKETLDRRVYNSNQSLKTTMIPLRQVYGEKLLKEDVKTYYINLRTSIYDGKDYNIKKEIYRMPDRLLDALAFYYCLDANSGFDRIDELKNKGYINENAKINFKNALAAALTIRLDIYLQANKRNDQLAVHEIIPRSGTRAVAILTPALRENMFVYYSVMQALQDRLFRKFFSKDSRQIVNQPLLETTNNYIDESNFNLASIHKRLLEYREAIKLMHQATLDNPLEDRAFYLYGMLSAKFQLHKEAIQGYRGAINAILSTYGKANTQGSAAVHLSGLSEELAILNIRLLLSAKGIASAYSELQETNNAEQWYQFASECAEKLTIENVSYKTGLLVSRGNFCRTQGQLSKAIQLYEEALDVISKESLVAATIYNNIGITYQQGHDYKKAYENLNESLQIKYKVYRGSNHGDVYRGSNPGDIANTYNNIAASLIVMNNLEAAKNYLDKASDILDKVLGSEIDHPYKAHILHNRGFLYSRKGDFQQAHHYLMQGLVMREKVWDSYGHPDIRASWKEITQLYADYRPPQVEETMKVLINHMQGNTHYLPFLYMGNIHMHIGHYDAAITCFKKAIAHSIEPKDSVLACTNIQVCRSRLMGMGCLYQQHLANQVPNAIEGAALTIQKSWRLHMRRASQEHISLQ